VTTHGLQRFLGIAGIIGRHPTPVGDHVVRQVAPGDDVTIDQ